MTDALLLIGILAVFFVALGGVWLYQLAEKRRRLVATQSTGGAADV